MRYVRRVYRAVRRILVKTIRRHWFRMQGIRYIAPDFIFFYTPERKKRLTIIDVGCGHEAEFSTNMIERYDAKCIAVDPTLKHKSALAHFAQKYQDRFIHVPFAVCASNSTLTFFQSNVNESGSIMTDHVNVVRDEGISYEVRGITPVSLLNYLRLDSADILKLDIEGAEYELLEGIGKDELIPFEQVFVEFHHHAVERYTETDTRKAVEKICDFGFESYSLDDHNYLFRRIA